MEPLRDDDPPTIGGYTLLGRIGVGGMGRVYLGESAAGQQVAVKVIKQSVLDEDSRARFLLEVDSLKTVYGPFVAAFVAADAAADHPWLAVEYVPGPDLRTFVTEHSPLPLIETASLGALLAEGLGAVHEAGLLHRDLTPQNILLASYGPKMIDFGLAVLAERRSSLTATGVIVGSVQCMPPEQARGDSELDTPADVYALGAVLLYAVTGHYPYSGMNWHAIAYDIGDANTPPDLSGLPPELEPLISTMLALEPADRPALRQVTRGLVAVLGDCGLTAAQAKRRLTELMPLVEVAQPPAVSTPTTQLVPDGVVYEPEYTPTSVDVAAWEDEGIPRQRGVAEPEKSEGEGERRGDDPVGADRATRAVDSAGASSRPSAPLRIAEQLRCAYAREARF